MQCFNCAKPVPKGAKRCLHCEADLSDMADLTAEDMHAAAKALEQALPGGLEALRAMAEGFDTAEDFANAIFVGTCPACDCAEVGTFEEVARIEDPTVARCFGCGHMWCTECLQPVADPKVNCGHWAVCEACGKDEDCEFLGDCTECPEVKEWLEQRDGAGMAAKKQKRPAKVVKDDRLFTLDVSIIDGPIIRRFGKENTSIGRTIEIRGDQTLEDLHDAIFDAFDRDDPHMYEFQIGGKGPMDPNARKYVLPMELESPFGDSNPAGTVDEPIGTLGLKKDDAFAYWFDFGDDWWHQINVIEIADKAGKGKYPKITKRIGDSPPQYPDGEGME